MIFLVVVKFLVFVSKVVSIFSKVLTWIIGRGQKDTFAPQLNYWGRAPQLPPKSTPMPPSLQAWGCAVIDNSLYLLFSSDGY